MKTNQKINKMEGLNPNTSKITLNVNSLNKPMKTDGQSV